jgi:hypothetical protein
MQTLRTTSAKIALLHWLSEFVAHGIFGRYNHLISASSLLKPLPNPFFTLAAVVGVGSVNEIAAQVIEGV